MIITQNYQNPQEILERQNVPGLNTTKLILRSTLGTDFRKHNFQAFTKSEYSEEEDVSKSRCLKHEYYPSYLTEREYRSTINSIFKLTRNPSVKKKIGITFVVICK